MELSIQSIQTTLSRCVNKFGRPIVIVPNVAMPQLLALALMERLLLALCTLMFLSILKDGDDEEAG